MCGDGVSFPFVSPEYFSEILQKRNELGHCENEFRRNCCRNFVSSRNKKNLFRGNPTIELQDGLSLCDDGRLAPGSACLSVRLDTLPRLRIRWRRIGGREAPGGVFLEVSFLYRPASCTAPASRHCCPHNRVRTPGGMLTECEVAVSYMLQRAWRSARRVSGPVPAGGVVIPVVL